MNKYFEIIYHLNKEIQIKWWLLKHYRSFINRIIALKQITPLTLNGTILHKLLQIIIYGKTVQDGEPTPETPVEIKNVEGKNLASLKTSSEKIIGGVPFIIEEGIIKINGTTNTSSNFYFDSFRTNGEVATFWLEVTGYTDTTTGSDSAILIQQSNDNSNWSTLQGITLNSATAKQYQVTLDNSKYYRIRFFTNGQTFTNAEIKIMLEYGTTKTPFIPYNSIEFKVENKNLFNGNKPDDTFGGATSSLINDILTVSSTTTATVPYVIFNLFDDLVENDEIRFAGIVQNSNGRIALQRWNGTSWNIIRTITYSDGASIGSNSFTIPAGVTKVRLLVYANTEIPTGASSSSYKNIIVTKNIQDMTYVAHQEQTAPFTFEEGQYLAEGGYLADDGIHNVMGQLIFDGTENWLVTNHRFRLLSVDTGVPISGGYPIYCNCYKRIMNYGSTGIWVSNSDYNNTKMLVIEDSSIDTLEDFKTMLSTKYSQGNPLYVQYQLGTPLITPYTPTQQAQWNAIKNMYTYKDQTNINVLANLDGIEIDIGYYGTNVLSQETLEELSNGRGE